MQEKIRQIIHRMDRRTDLLRDGLLLKMAAGIRDGLMDMPDDQTTYLTDPAWEKLCEKLTSRSAESLSAGEKIHMFLNLTGYFAASGLGEKADYFDKLRAACEAQRNRIRFLRIMKPLRNEMIRMLPEAERSEEESAAQTQERMMEEHLNAALFLYRLVSTDRRSRSCQDQLRRLERLRIPVDAQQEEENRLTRIHAIREFLEESENNLEFFLSRRRRMAETEGYELYRTEEGGKENDADQRNPAETEKHGSPERNPEEDASQPPSSQHGNRREKNAEIGAVPEAESD